MRLVEGVVRRAAPGLALGCGLVAVASAQQAGEDWLYRVERGDTLIGLHQRLLRPEARWREVQRLNRVADPRRLRPGSTLRIPLAMLREQPVLAEVLHRHGEVVVERAGRAPRQPLDAAASLAADDVVITGAQSSATLRFADGSRVLIGPDSRLRVERHVRLGTSNVVDTRLRLDAGGVATQVQPAKPAPRFELRTPVINLGVRGTEFRSRIDGTRTLAEVTEGRVGFGGLPLAAGFGAAATAAGPEPARALLAAPDLARLPERIERVPLQLALVPLAGAARYRAQVFDGERLVLDGLFDAPAAAWNVDLPDGRYELRARGADADGIEGRDARHAFTLKARPEPPFLLRPRSDERVTDDEVLLAWSRNPDAASYRVQVAATPDFAAPLVEREGLGGTEASVAVPLGRHHWRVRSVRADGDLGPWGDPRPFERAAKPPPPTAPAPKAPRESDQGILLGWSASPIAGATYQVQAARDAAFGELVLDEKTTGTEVLLPKPAPGTYHVRVRAVGPDGRAGPWGTPQTVDVPRSLWWLWLLPLLLLL
jgi:hypothetical protein